MANNSDWVIAVSFDKEKSELKKLVNNFQSNEADYSRHNSIYNETQLRKDFVEPFFELLGWDVNNKNGLPQNLREVAYEATITSSGESFGKPDYAFRLAGKRKFFVETKKPAVHVERDSQSAYQLRRYGWSAHNWSLIVFRLLFINRAFF
jgi:adenine-specific DNA-methyltransferase